jgi:hypothetical protein
MSSERAADEPENFRSFTVGQLIESLSSYPSDSDVRIVLAREMAELIPKNRVCYDQLRFDGESNPGLLDIDVDFKVTCIPF